MTTETTPAEPAADAEPAAPRPAGAHVVALAVSAILVLLLDQVSKAVALLTLTPGVRIPALGDLLGWRLIFNPGAAFSFGTGVTWVFTLVMAIVSVAVLVAARRIGSRIWAIALGALLGGALGNLVDRLAREPGFAVGHVVDFIDYGVFIGNVADIAIVGAAIGMVALSLFGSSWEGRPASSSVSETTDDDSAAGRGDVTSDDGAAAEGAAGRDDVTSEMVATDDAESAATNERP